MKYLILLLFPVLLFGQLVSEGFEGTGLPTDWTTVSGTVDYDYTTIALNGAQSAILSKTATNAVVHSPSFNIAEGWVFFTSYSPTAAGTSTDLCFIFCDTPNYLLLIYPDGRIRVYSGATNDYTSAGTYVYADTNNIWIHFNKGTGSNATIDVYHSLTYTRPASPNVSITAGTVVDNATYLELRCYTTAGGANIYDNVIVSETELGDFGSPPATPTGLSPANAATGVSANPSLSCATQADADSFYFKLSKNADLTSALYDTMVNTNSLLVSLDYVTQYYWLVGAWNNIDTTLTDTVSFTTKKLATPTNRRPIANATYVDSATTFSWASNAEADSFYLQIGDSALASLVLDTAIVANSLLYTLVNDSSYWWSVAAKNSLDTSAWSDTTKFTTGIRPVSSSIKYNYGDYGYYGGYIIK